jgi:hypothetical protein
MAEQVAQLSMFDEPDVHTTFRGGKVAPLHRWFPFPEGYSPRFVEQIVEKFAPDAQRILDPFSGTGTTPLTVARLGREAFYAEINPFLQHLTQAKIRALLLSDRDRQLTAAALLELSESSAQQLKAAPPIVPWRPPTRSALARASSSGRPLSSSYSAPGRCWTAWRASSHCSLNSRRSRHWQA